MVHSLLPGAPPFQVGLNKALALDLDPQNPLPQRLLGPGKQNPLPNSTTISAFWRGRAFLGGCAFKGYGGSPPSVRVSSFSPTNCGFLPLAACPLARCPSPAHSPAADETKAANDATYSNSVEEAPLVIFNEGNVLLNEGNAPTNGLPPSSLLRSPSLPLMRVPMTTLLRLVLSCHWMI